MRERLFAVSNGPIRWSADDAESTGPAFRTVRERVPDWLTDKVAGDILHTITMWRYAYVEDDLVIYIPMDWVPVRDRLLYQGSRLFDRPLRLNPYITEPQVAATVKEKPKR